MHGAVEEMLRMYSRSIEHLTLIIEGIKNLMNIIVDPSTIAQAAIPQILKKTTEEFHQQKLQLLSHAADICYDRIQKLNVLYCPAKPQCSMVVMVKINISGFVDIRDDIEFSAMLCKEESVIVLPGSPIGLKNWIRVTFAISPSVLEEGLDRISAFCMRHAKNT
jgi:tyrosine aminotransferase